MCQKSDIKYTVTFPTHARINMHLTWKRDVQILCHFPLQLKQWQPSAHSCYSYSVEMYILLHAKTLSLILQALSSESHTNVSLFSSISIHYLHWVQTHIVHVCFIPHVNNSEQSSKASFEANILSTLSDILMSSN